MTDIALRDFLLQFAPELGGRLYVAFDDLGPDTLGVAGGLLDLILRPRLDWQGRGAAILVNGPELRAEAAALVADGLDPIEAELWSFGRMGLHELAHVLDRPAPFYSEEQPVPSAEETVAFLATDRPTPSALPAWYGHESNWLRIVCHLACRARARDLNVSAAAIVGNHRGYGLSHPSRYEAALNDEPEQMAHVSLSELTTVPMPTEFQRLFESDIAADNVSADSLH